MRKSIRSITSLILALVLSATLLGCATGVVGTTPTSTSPTLAPATTVPTAMSVAPTATAPAPEATPTEVPPEPTATPDTSLAVTDSLGREVTLPAPAERIVSLAPSLTEILFAIGAGDRVVGVTSYCNYPPEADEIEEIGGFSADSISVESIVALEPDLVLGTGATHQAIIDALEPLGIPMVSIDPQSVDEVYAALDQAGYLTGLEEEAAAAADAMRQRIEAVTAVVDAIPEEERLTVYWQIWDEPLMTAGPNTFVGQLIQLAGGVSIFTDLTEDYPTVSAEEVVARNPDVIMGPDSHGDKLTVEVFSEKPGWEDIAAVQNGRIHLINGDIASRAGPRLADALEAVAAALYPDLFQ